MLFLNESNMAAEIKAKDAEQLLRLNKCSYYTLRGLIKMAQ